MLTNFTNEVELLKVWHKRAKEIAIKAESMDSLNQSYVQPLHELRYCLDHFMRSLDYEENKKNEENIKKSIRSAIGHLQRTYSDSIEWMLVNVKEEYVLTLDGYTNEQVQMAFPEYYTEIRLALEKIAQIVDEYKINKSVEKATITEISADGEVEVLQNVANQFLAEDVAEKLQNYMDILHSREVSLIEVKVRDKKAVIKDKVILPIVTADVGAIIATVVTACILI